MIYRIDITSTIEDTRAKVKKKYFESLGFKGKITDVFLIDSYTIDADINETQIKEAASALINPLIEKASISLLKKPAPRESGFDWAIEIGFLPGVTDTVGLTAKETIADRLGIAFKQNEGVYTSVVYFISGSFSENEIKKLADNLYNPLIQQARIKSFSQFQKDTGMGIEAPKVSLRHKPRVTTIDLNIADKQLEKLGKEGIENHDGTRRGPLALSLSEMKVIQIYFKKLKRNPTDVELETLAQTWSEHCKHTIFNDPIDDIKDGLFKTYIKRATEEIRTLRQAQGKEDFCVSVFKDNSGAIVFDKDYLITHKVETHNSPSALDPFGGAVTGIVGVNRDCLGFGLGAKPIVNTYGFCFADPSDKTVLYRDRNKTQKMLSPRRIMEGVINGVNVGGNSTGIPTPLGFVFFDERFRGKPLVFVGTIGIIPKKSAGRLSHVKKAEVGDYIVMLGGRVGLDGIHGATFSSEDLNVKSQTSSVQIGDPITQKKLSDAIVRGARDKGLYNSITDNGAGGLSSSVGETAEQSGGCEVWLDKVPLKYPGLDPWQIWISESQERMTLAVPKNKWKEFKKVMELHDVEATVIGKFTDSGSGVVKYDDKTVMDISMEFLHNGRPKKQQKSKKSDVSTLSSPTRSGIYIDSSRLSRDENDIITMLKELNITSYEFISQQFDHTVQGTSVIQPLHGKGRVNADAIVVKPLPDSDKGIVTSHGINPTDSDIDTYYMAASAIDSAIRNALSVGANPDYLAILDNFCWSSSDEPERLYELKQAIKACYDYATIFGTPFISGKDSMFNDFKGFDESGKPIKISAPPTLLISTLGVIPDVKKSLTLDFKSAGDLIYILGDMMNDPKKNKKLYQACYQAIQKNLIASAIAVGRGGLAIALAKSAIGGMVGIEIELPPPPRWPAHPSNPDLVGKSENGFLGGETVLFFTESQGRLVVSVLPENQKQFENLLDGNSYSLIGKVTNDSNIIINKINLEVKKAFEAYKSTLKNY